MKGITPKMSILSVFVIINKCSFESFMCLDLVCSHNVVCVVTVEVKQQTSTVSCRVCMSLLSETMRYIYLLANFVLFYFAVFVCLFL